MAVQLARRRPADGQAQIAALRRAIREHDYRYHVLDRPTISDEQYDRLFVELVALERSHPELVTRDSPTQRVAGAPSEGLVAVRHAAPMLSLEATTEEADVLTFATATARALDATPAWVLEPKYDGLSAQHERHGGDRAHVGRDILAAFAVAPRRRRDQHARVVDQLDTEHRRRGSRSAVR